MQPANHRFALAPDEDRHQVEYAPAPPFDAGRPEQCPPAVLALVKQRGAALRAEREVIVGRIARSHRTAGNSPDWRVDAREGSVERRDWNVGVLFSASPR